MAELLDLSWVEGFDWDRGNIQKNWEGHRVAFYECEEVFFREYRGKHLVIGHTTTNELPQELSKYTPADPDDLWAGDYVTALDTGCGKGGFLTAFELPSRLVYESR